MRVLRHILVGRVSAGLHGAAPAGRHGARCARHAGPRVFFPVAPAAGGLEITVSPLDGPLEGIAVKDVFVVENIAVERAAAAK